MGKRNTSRRLAMQTLYSIEVGEFDLKTALANTRLSDEFQKDSFEFAEELAQGVIENQKEIDAFINEKSKKWKFDRISAVDKSILRISIFELMTKENPIEVIINEAVELAKKYSSDESGKFINGILGEYVKQDKKSKNN